MRNYVAGVVFLCSLASCSTDWESARTAGKVIATANANNPNPRAANFASLPDRGGLLAYAPGTHTRKGLRAYEVRLSEAHALKAAHEGGQIVVAEPDGSETVFVYRRHIEHPDGNWTWIGGDGEGANAVITFGEKAVFGTIPQADGENLRLTTVAGRAWLMRGGRIGSMGPQKDANTGRSDALVPQATPAERSQSESPGAHSALTMMAHDRPPAIIDVLLGYTAGYARALGGSSEAVTRLNYLVDTANQAYANSGVNVELRLVGAMAVDYADASDNAQALEQLTGLDEAGSVAIAPRLVALRAARESHAADLVALVRDFHAPQNGGCGVAWLIGGGQSIFDVSRASYGYAVVNDGIDIDETDGMHYYCRDESLAHEFGHSLGQAHDREDSRQTGVHAYAYGYREAAGSGFYTVMAYSSPGSSQVAIPYFANPEVSYEDRPTGIVNEADNARSMNWTAPIVAKFRIGDDEAEATQASAINAGSQASGQALSALE